MAVQERARGDPGVHLLTGPDGLHGAGPVARDVPRRPAPHYVQGMATTVIAAAAARAEREIIDHFRREGATAPERATDLPSLRPLGERRLRRLLAARIVQRTEGGYWLDENLYASYRADRRVLMIAVLVAVVAVGIAVLLAQRA